MGIQLSDDARASLGAICDTFVPGTDGLPSATDLHVHDVILDVMGGNPSADARGWFAGLIEGWDPAFAAGSQEERERDLLAWCDSADVMQRASFQALRKLTLVFYYTLPWQGEGPNPVDAALGYPGPHGVLPDASPKTITPLEITGDTELECDVVVVGSGAGGGTAAGVLAAAGLDVVVVEAGGYYSEEDFDGAELSGYARLYLGGGGIATPNGSIGLLAGSCLGGGTTVNYTWCFRPPDHVRREWQERFGLDDWAGTDFDDSLDAVWDRIRVNPDNSPPSRRDLPFRAGLAELGWDSQVMQRNTVGCTEDICGQCHYGCPTGAKQSTLKTWLQDAYDAGARIVVNAPVDKVVIENGEAKGRRGDHGRRAQADRPRPRRRRGRRSDRHAGGAGPLGPRQPERRQEPDDPPGAAGLGTVRGGDPPLDRASSARPTPTSSSTWARATASSTCTPRSTRPTSPSSHPGAAPASTRS